MLCSICKKNEANVHIVKIINGEKQEFNICEKCAKEREGVGLGYNLNSPFTFQNILGGIIDYMHNTGDVNSNIGPKCKVCGMSYEEFKKTGLVGCSECYQTFNKALMPVIKRVQGNVEHVGKIPTRLGKDILEKKKILKLKEELQKAIVTEEYERAAEIRDEIKKLQNEG